MSSCKIWCLVGGRGQKFQNLYKKFWFLRGNFHPDPRSLEGIFKIPEQAMGIWLKIPDQKPEFRIYFFIGHYNFTQCFACKTTLSANLTLKCNMHSSFYNLNHLRFLNLIVFYISTFSHLLTFYTPETHERAH